MENWLRKTIELGAGLAFLEKANPSVIPYIPSKTALPAGEKRFFKRIMPERAGVSSARLYALLSELESNAGVNIHNFICLRDGCVISECSGPSYSVNTWHLSHSMSKTLVGIGIGMLVDEGLLSLDERVCEILGEKPNDEKYARLTVEHLLTMSSGVRFAELGIVSESKWTDAFFSSEFAFEPGGEFGYNSMNTYVLGRVIEKKSGKGLTDFFRGRLLLPLGIADFFWEKGPEGIEKGGMGVFMSIESWCKIGMMMLSGGVFYGRRIISEKWVRASTLVHITTPAETGAYDYGYHIWVSKENESYLFSGMFGQDLWINPKNKIIVGINAGNNELFQNSPALAIIEKYLSSDLSQRPKGVKGGIIELRELERRFLCNRHWIKPFVPARSFFTRLGILRPAEYPREWADLLGSYDLARNNTGVLPLFVRLLQNNLAGGIENISFFEEKNKMIFSFSEAGQTYKLKIGFTDYEMNEINYRGEKYLLGVMGEVCEDEDRQRLYKLLISMPEMPNTRRIKLRLQGPNKLTVTMEETPDHKAVAGVVSDLGAGGNTLSFLLELLKRRLGKNFAEEKLREIFVPALVGARCGAEDYDAILAEEEGKRNDGAGAKRIVNSIVERLAKNEDKSLSEGGIRALIGEIFGKIKKKVPIKFRK